MQQGAASPLAVLTRYFELTADPRLPGLLSAAGHWIADRTHPRSTRPGLHFGDLGTAWALYEAGRAIDDRALVDHALDLALTPQEPTLHHDITHGTAGSGMAALHLWHRTGDPRLAERAVDAADRLASAARRDPSAVSWPVPAEALSGEAGKRYLGFAHGSMRHRLLPPVQRRRLRTPGPPAARGRGRRTPPAQRRTRRRDGPVARPGG